MKNIFLTILFLLKKINHIPIMIYQFINYNKIPIIIINYNQLFYFKQLVEFLLKRGFENVIVIDNNSSYPPLLEYYEQIKENVCVELRKDNLGHMVFYKDEKYLQKYGNGLYVLTDADIVPNDLLPRNFLRKMILVLFRYIISITKVGFAINLTAIPDYYPFKRQVLNWENQYWKDRLKDNLYRADIDTTFAIYFSNENYLNNPKFFKAIRMAGNYESIHGGWYIDPNNLTEEQKYYMNTANNSSSWKMNEKKDLANQHFINAYRNKN